MLNQHCGTQHCVLNVPTVYFSLISLHAFFQENPQYSPDRVNAFQGDVTQDKLSDHVNLCSVNIVTMIFVLSAIHPNKMAIVLRNIYEVSVVGTLHAFGTSLFLVMLCYTMLCHAMPCFLNQIYATNKQS